MQVNYALLLANYGMQVNYHIMKFYGLIVKYKLIGVSMQLLYV